MTEKSNLEFNILNQLKNGRIHHGMVGSKVSANGDNPNNKAWITVIMKKGADYGNEIMTHYFLNYEIEYLEFDEKYDEEIHGNDWDLFLIRTEKFYNIRDEKELEKTLKKWLKDVNVLKPISNIDLPNL